jgi:UDP-N-acetylmuramyl tripeptide synthase
MGKYRRGRAEGELCLLQEPELRTLGAPASMIEHVENEAEAARTALAWAQEGDLLILLVHEKREEVLRVLEEAGRREAGKTGS